MSTYDVIFVLPYVFCDHPSFPEGLLKRTLERAGFSVGVLETPRWQETDAFTRLGRPRLFFAIISGPVDSMVLNYTSLRKRRKEDLYQIAGAYFPGMPPSVSSRIRPDRTLIVFANRLRQAFRDVPLVIGGIEATMRRFTHYDFLQDAFRRPLLLDSRADVMVAGMGEKQLVRLAREMARGGVPGDTVIPGTVRLMKSVPDELSHVALPSHEEILSDPAKLLLAQRLVSDAARQNQAVVQAVQGRFVVQAPFQEYTSLDLDAFYDEPYRRQHLAASGFSPALLMNLFSVTAHRGCFGSCAFCSIHGHQGGNVLSRSPESIVREVHSLASHPRWKGMISDIGGPTAEMYGSENLKASKGVDPGYGRPYLELLRECRKIPGVKKVFVGSGIRYDFLEKNPELLEEILRFHSGRFLRVAPEHTENHVLKWMGKPPFEEFSRFLKLFRSLNLRMKRPVELALYLIVGHPGEREKDVVEMKKKLRALDLTRCDVQVFTPTPGTLSTAMYASGQAPGDREIEIERSVSALSRRLNFLTH